MCIARIEKTQVSLVGASITLTNHVDQVLAANAYMPTDEVRRATFEHALVDPDASSLYLPTDTIEALGLSVCSENLIETSAGLCENRVFDEVYLCVNGRQSTFKCLELKDGEHPLIGVHPLRCLGLEPDLPNQRLRLLMNYVYAMGTDYFPPSTQL